VGKEMTNINTDPQALDPAQQQLLIQAWLNAPVPRVYANGLAVAHTAADLAIVFVLNGSPTTIVNLSLTTAKSLATELSKALAGYESATKQEIMTIDEIAELLKKPVGAGISVG
jgi:hypothetical protein